MTQAVVPQDSLKLALKEALAETIEEHRDLFRDVVAEAMEDRAFVMALEEGEQTEEVSRDEVFNLLDGTP